MATTNRERVSSSMDLLYDGLLPYVKREMLAEYRTGWFAEAENAIGRTITVGADGEPHLDISTLLQLMMKRWQEVFKKKLSHNDRNYVGELYDARNRWAHQQAFGSEETYRVLDTVHLLLSVVSAPEAAEVDRMKQEALRVRYNEQTRTVRRRQASGDPAEQHTGAAGLTSWREIVIPHPDVAGGNFRKAEFAADLSQVHRGDAVPEYQDPRSFFQRTYLTEGLKSLLINALNQLDGEAGGDPVVKLQTNFGGGKTHSMLALYHLFSGIEATDLSGLEEILTRSGVPRPSAANRAVLVGTALSPGQRREKPDGTVVHTLWGELAWQLLGTQGYALLAEADRTGTNPGSQVLGELFRQAEPSLILIDEWVAFVRQLYGVNDLPAGSFDANLSFAQSLAEAASATRGTLIVASLPASDIEIGGEAGREALTRLEHTFRRVDTTWRPAGTEESYEIVRRRIFEPLTDPGLSSQRDAVIQQMHAFYRGNASNFPSECREESYRRQMEAAYPIHPELFERLNEDWGSLDRFQRTRGVLRLMASVVHVLWERNDNSPMIMPGMLPLDHPDVREELMHYLDLGWAAVVEKDVDGEGALPIDIDRENAPTLGRYQATRRVARTIFLGSAPIPQAANRGIDENRIRLGSVQPGESPSTFGDALRRLTDRATYLYVDGQRYWYSTQPTVNRLARDRAAQQSDDAIYTEIVERVRKHSSERGDFARVHAVPASGGDVPDERETRLVILGPDHPHTTREERSPARNAAAAILDSRGSAPRQYRNTLVFLAPDRTRLTELEDAVRTYRAWKSIFDERTQLNLDPFQENQAAARLKEADQTVESRIPGTFNWLLVPTQPDPTGPVVWEEARLQGEDRLAPRAARRLKNDMTLLTEMAPSILKMRLYGIPLWRENHISVRDLADYYAQYLYLERLRDSNVLLTTIQKGVSSLTWMQDSFAYAQSWNPDSGRYEGLLGGGIPTVISDGRSVIVKPDVAQAQIQEDRRKREEIAAQSTSPGGDTPYEPGDVDRTGGVGETTTVIDTTPAVLNRFYGTVDLDNPLRLGSEAGRIADEVLTHLAALPGAKVRVTLEIHAELPDGANDHTIRTVTENARTLKFHNAEFEEE